MKLPVIFFTIADDKNLKDAKMCEKTFKHFHPDIPFRIFGQEELDQIKDPNKFYKGTPLFARDLLKEFELVVKVDCDQLFLGKLDYVLNQKYDIGGVLNVNRVDPLKYGYVQGWGIAPNEYLNAGFVAMRSLEFVERWWELCNSFRFDRFQYREQDILNILFYYGGFKGVCFDNYDEANKYYAWHGLVAKGETNRAVLEEVNGEKEVVLYPGEDGYPGKRTVIKALHWAGGQGEVKMDYQKQFSEEVIEYIDSILYDKTK